MKRDRSDVFFTGLTVDNVCGLCLLQTASTVKSKVPSTGAERPYEDGSTTGLASKLSPLFYGGESLLFLTITSPPAIIPFDGEIPISRARE